MQHHSIRSVHLAGEIIDFVCIETCGATSLGVLTIRTAQGIENTYCEGRCLQSALETLFPQGWKGRRVNLTLESHGMITVESAP